MKALIVFGTRYGATRSTSELIAEVLQECGFETKVVEAKKEKINDIQGYDLVIVGSGIRMGRWTKEPVKFLKKYRSELMTKKLALFVSSAAWPMTEPGGPYADFKDESQFSEDTLTKEEAYQEYLLKKAEELSLKPVSFGLFGGVWDFDQFGGFLRRTMRRFRENLESKGIDMTKPYDNRNPGEIRKWVIELVGE